MGFTWGRRRDYAIAVLYPLVVLAAAALVAGLAGAIDVSTTDWRKAALNMALIGLSTVIVATATEEGFFRGWLVASLKRAGCSQVQMLLWSSVAFSLWHLSGVSLDTGIGFDLPAAQIPVFMANAFLLGVIWGMLRLISGSVVVASVSHGVWNGINYALFAFGEKVGALGVKETGIFGPEVGVVGLALNIIYAAMLWRWWRVRGQSSH
ncbi:MAG: CPBP family intramembrane glutamic endopeptidase [Candidatus Krumholzibacteria bacterium]